jgi:hypothetical protein
MRCLVVDPGESSGWIFEDESGQLQGGTVKLDRWGFWKMLHHLRPQRIVFEGFKLYPGFAKSLSWNTFYTCEMIGLLKLYAEMNSAEIVAHSAAQRKYGGAKTSDEAWRRIQDIGVNVTNHTFDAYMHYCYYKRNKPK